MAEEAIKTAMDYVKKPEMGVNVANMMSVEVDGTDAFSSVEKGTGFFNFSQKVRWALHPPKKKCWWWEMVSVKCGAFYSELGTCRIFFLFF